MNKNTFTVIFLLVPFQKIKRPMQIHQRTIAQKKKFKIKICFIFVFVISQNGQNCFLSVQGKNTYFFKFIFIFRSFKITEYIPLVAGLKIRWNLNIFFADLSLKSNDTLELRFYKNLAQHRKCNIFSTLKSLHPTVLVRGGATERLCVLFLSL